MGRKQLTESVKAERLEFLVEIGLDKSILNKCCNKNCSDVEVMRASYDFFSELGADVQKTFKANPMLLGLHRDSSLEPKLKFLTEKMGLSRDKLAKEPEVFTRSIDTMLDVYRHFLDKFGENEAQVKKIFMTTTRVIGNKIESIDEKIRKYDKAGIDFHRNYSLLEGNPETVIDTKHYLDELGIQPPKTKKWYHILLTVSRNVLKSKVDYCEKEQINWSAHPKVLVLGLGTEESPGALPRRVEMIKNAFDGSEIPPELNYKSNPLIIEKLNDEKLRTRIRKYKST